MTFNASSFNLGKTIKITNFSVRIDVFLKKKSIMLLPKIGEYPFNVAL